MKKKNKTFSPARLVLYIVVTLGAITMIMPLVWMISTSLKQSASVFELPPQWIPNPFDWKNYTEIWDLMPFGRFFFNSLFIALCVTAGQLFTSSLAGYAFARMSFRGRDKLFLAYLATLMIPYAVTMIPVFLILRNLGWIDTYKALILPGIFTAYGTFMMRQFFMSIPKDLEEAAFIDGCSHFGIYFKIILPLSKPILATLGTFTFIGSWRNFMWPLIVTNSDEMRTLPVGLSAFQGQYMTDWPLLMATAIFVMTPLVIVFLFNQRFFVESFKLSGIKT